MVKEDRDHEDTWQMLGVWRYIYLYRSVSTERLLQIRTSVRGNHGNTELHFDVTQSLLGSLEFSCSYLTLNSVMTHTKKNRERGPIYLSLFLYPIPDLKIYLNDQFTHFKGPHGGVGVSVLASQQEGKV